MKRTLFSFLAFISIIQVDAQSRWIFSTGITNSTFDKDLMEIYGFESYRQEYISAGGSATSEAKNSLKVGGYVSVIHEIAISEKGMIRAGVKYLTIGDAYFFKTDDVVYESNTSSTDGKIKMRPRLDYFAIPVQYGSRVSERMTMYVGLTPQFNVDNLFRFNYFEGSGDDVKEKWDRIDNPVNARGMVVFAGAGFNYYIDQMWVLEFNVNKSINSVYDDARANSLINETGAWNFELGIGIALK